MAEILKTSTNKQDNRFYLGKLCKTDTFPAGITQFMNKVKRIAELHVLHM